MGGKDGGARARGKGGNGGAKPGGGSKRGARQPAVVGRGTEVTPVLTTAVVAAVGVLAAAAVVMLATTGSAGWGSTGSTTAIPPEVFTGKEASLADLDLASSNAALHPPSNECPWHRAPWL